LAAGTPRPISKPTPEHLAPQVRLVQLVRPANPAKTPATPARPKEQLFLVKRSAPAAPRSARLTEPLPTASVPIAAPQDPQDPVAMQGRVDRQVKPAPVEAPVKPAPVVRAEARAMPVAVAHPAKPAQAAPQDPQDPVATLARVDRIHSQSNVTNTAFQAKSPST